MHLSAVEMMKTFDITQIPNYRDRFKIVCEDPRLSLPFVCKTVRILNIAKVNPMGLGAGEFECLLAMCAASLHIEAVEPNGPSQKNIKNNYLYYNPTFKLARDAMSRLSVLTGHVVRSVPAVKDANDEER